jgi:hypothetical protein
MAWLSGFHSLTGWHCKSCRNTKGTFTKVYGQRASPKLWAFGWSKTNHIIAGCDLDPTPECHWTWGATENWVTEYYPVPLKAGTANIEISITNTTSMPGTVLVFEPKYPLEDAKGYHTCWLEVSRRVTNSTSLGCPLPLTDVTIPCVETLKAWRRWPTEISTQSC